METDFILHGRRCLVYKRRKIQIRAEVVRRLGFQGVAAVRVIEARQAATKVTGWAVTKVTGCGGVQGSGYADWRWWDRGEVGLEFSAVGEGAMLVMRLRKGAGRPHLTGTPVVVTSRRQAVLTGRRPAVVTGRRPAVVSGLTCNCNWLEE
ncbi:unnamed protein product [Cuscuta epithymum]|uniref:Uncharacterized protein n=1 Tax=Cuscuta epithymum TaxID=186058 RepID=A0AAV0DTG4_9ASTE|nr:unnamed protein product [Cuscuta epithymum]